MIEYCIRYNNDRIACYNGEGPERAGNPRSVQRQLPKLQLTVQCLSSHARYGKLSAGPPIAAFDLRRLKGGNTPRIRVTQQAGSVVGSGGASLYVSHGDIPPVAFSTGYHTKLGFSIANEKLGAPKDKEQCCKKGNATAVDTDSRKKISMARLSEVWYHVITTGNRKKK